MEPDMQSVAIATEAEKNNVDQKIKITKEVIAA